MDRPFPPTFRILADINLTGNGYRIQKSVAPLLLALFIERCSRHNWYYVACFKGLLHRSIVASFSGRLSPRPTAKSPRGEGRGARALFRLLALRPLLAGSSHAAVSSLELSEKHFAAAPDKPRFSPFSEEGQSAAELDNLFFGVFAITIRIDLANRENSRRRKARAHFGLG